MSVDEWLHSKVQNHVRWLINYLEKVHNKFFEEDAREESGCISPDGGFMSPTLSLFLLLIYERDTPVWSAMGIADIHTRFCRGIMWQPICNLAQT
jgi:hypothetical protein